MTGMKYMNHRGHGAHRDKTEKRRNSGCPDAGSLLVDFGYLCTFVSWRETLFVVLSHKVVAQRTKGDNPMILRTSGFP